MLSPLVGVDYSSEIVTGATILGGVLIGIGNVVAMTSNEEHGRKVQATPCSAEMSAAALIDEVG